MNPMMQSTMPDLPKIVPATKDQKIACSQCTFLNAAEAKVCGVCEAELQRPTHEIQANGMWKCGTCSTLNRKGLKQCTSCQTLVYASVTSSAPSQIFCPKCSFLNDGENIECVQCDHQLRSRLDKIGTDLRDSTNLLVRDMGVNITVKCPGCHILCSVPPATAGLRCGTCHTYFSSPTVGEVTNFHMTRLASSISSSFRGFFRRDSVNADADRESEAPVGRLIALGQFAPRELRAASVAAASPRSSSPSLVLNNSASFRHSDPGDEEEKTEEVVVGDELSSINGTEEEQQVSVDSPRGLTPVAHTETIAQPRNGEEPETYDQMYPMPHATPVKSVDTFFPTAMPVLHASTTTSVAPMALPAAHTQDLYKVEGDIVEL